jgi:hypothetical protein
MKRRDLIRHLEQHGCELLREGSRHSVFVQPHNWKVVHRSAAQRSQRLHGHEDLPGSSDSYSVAVAQLATADAAEPLGTIERLSLAQSVTNHAYLRAGAP